MKCFPLMYPAEGKRCLLVGGGAVALRKARTLARFGVVPEVCAHEVLPELAAVAAGVHREYDPAYLRGAAFAVAATDDARLNARVAADCRAAGIPVNAVDDKENCDFYFPAVIVRGDVVIGLSTGGASPALAAALRRRIERTLPPGLERIARRAEELRGTLCAEEYAAAVEKLLDGEDV